MLLPLRDPYPTRTEQPALLTRRDPVVWSDDASAGPWSAESVEQYCRDGFIVRERLFDSAEIAALRDELRRLDGDHELRQRSGVIGDEHLRSLFETPRLSPVLDALSRDPRLLAPAQHLLDDEVYLHQSRVHYRAALAQQESHWHSDFETWHAEDGMRAMRSLSVVITLGDDEDYEGPLRFIPGSHTQFVSCAEVIAENDRRRASRAQLCGRPDPLFLSLLSESGAGEPVRAPAGSAIFFDCNLLHAGGVGERLPESTASFIYNALSNQLKSPLVQGAERPDYLAERGAVRELQPRAADYAKLAERVAKAA
jgi:ectoine hydroxylase